MSDLTPIYLHFFEGEKKILNVAATCQPFQVGQEVSLQIENRNKDFWDRQEMPLTPFVVTAIESFVTITYSGTALPRPDLSFLIYLQRE